MIEHIESMIVYPQPQYIPYSHTVTNFIVTTIIFLVMFIGIMWCLNQYRIHYNDPFEEIPNTSRWNLPEVE